MTSEMIYRGILLTRIRERQENLYEYRLILRDLLS